MANRHFLPGLFERLFLAFPRLIDRQLSTNPNSNVKNRDELNGYSQNLPFRETFLRRRLLYYFFCRIFPFCLEGGQVVGARAANQIL